MGQQQPILEHFAALLESLGDSQPQWLAEQRRQAFDRVVSRGLPGRKIESWHYTPVDQWLAERLEGGGADIVTADESVDGTVSAALAGAVFTFSHGRLAARNAAAETLDGVKLIDLAGLDEKSDGELIAWLGSAREDALAEMVDALAPAPQLLAIDGSVDTPIILHHHASAAGTNLPRMIVQVAAGANATVIEHFSGADCDYLTAAHTTIIAGRDSSLTWLRVNRDSESGQHIGLVDLEQQTGSSVRLQSLATGGRRVRTGLHVALTGDDTELECAGAFVAVDHQHVDHHVAINHLGARGTSRTRFHGVAGDHGRGVMNGRLYIARDTHGNDGRLATHNLLLSDAAEIDAKPELEIYAEDVSCAHGATVGQLDAEQLLYLRTRCIDRDTAVALLTEGFLRSGLLELDGTAADYLGSQLERALTALGRAREAA